MYASSLHKINKSSTFTEARLVVVDTHWGVLVIFHKTVLSDFKL